MNTGSQYSIILQKATASLGESKNIECIHNQYEIYVSSVDNKYNAFSQLIYVRVVLNIRRCPWIMDFKMHKIELTETGIVPADIELLIGADIAGTLITEDRFGLH